VRVGGARATGAYFAEQTTESAMAAISRWENELERDFRPEYAREWAAGFGLPRFLEQYRAFVLEHVPEAEAEAIPASAAAAIVSA
jgi:hypothetical protein